ncbi:PREDICTED: actin cytoskeleton-regulatory complex protein PAN1-like [Amphimedon queenslandica]|uniref:FYVE-type domain-containing protein n=1 Tax=Amphimedon queenslandica TaxID=400682 RepID=A0AAN0IV88_AMPQE|nr:PREDICTED: actin cytoskeleton-regulatory complex protein PAN1-like [Amphimedon queenslandica]|eukprot:XP_019848740.1 PREDICTED: actin cytoskeleton-regulatory complex protein PAN1-like [Amphimedon queenslandica]
MLVSPLLSNETTLPWWICPPDRELSLRSKIRTGYSTIASRANINKYHPIVGVKVRGLSVDELMTIEEVVKKASLIEEMNEMRISSLLSDHDKLKEQCIGDGEYSCLLCGYDFTQQNAEKSNLCHICAKMICRECRYDDVMSNHQVYLCPVCFSHKELWGKTGAWMVNSLPKQIKNKEKLTEWISKTSELKRHKSSLDMSGIELGGAIRQDTSQNLLESISDTEILNENRFSSYDVKFKDEPSSNNRSIRKTNVTSSWNTLEGLQEEEKIGIDDLLLAQQLRSESPHLRLESEHRRASAHAKATPSPPSSPRRSKAMIGQEQRASLVKARRNVLSRTPSPQGYAAEGNSPPMLRRDGSQDDSPGMRRRGSSKEGSGLLIAGLRPSLTVPTNSFDSDSSVEVNKELQLIHQMGSTTDEEMPYIMISSDADLPFYNKEGSLPKLRRKNASRRRTGSLTTRGEKEKKKEEKKETENDMFNQDGMSDLSFQPLESDLSFKPLESDLNFRQPAAQNKSDENEEKGEESKLSEDITKAAASVIPAATGDHEMKTEKEEEKTKMEETHQSLPEPSPVQEDITPPASVLTTDDTTTPPTVPSVSDTLPAPVPVVSDTPPATVPVVSDTPPATVDDTSPATVDDTSPAPVPIIDDTPPASVPSTDDTGTAAIVPPGVDDNTPSLNEDLSDLSFSFRKSDDEEEEKFKITTNKPQATAALSPTSSPQISKSVTPPTADLVTQSPIKTLPPQSPERDTPTPTKSPSPHRRKLVVKSTPSQKELETPPTSSASPEKTKNEVAKEEEEFEKKLEEKPSSSLRRKNATRLSRSPRRDSSKSEATPSTTQEGEMGTLERKRAKAREAARRLRESGQSSQYRMEGETTPAVPDNDGMSSLERKRAKAKEAAKRMRESGESSQSRIERDAKGEIIQETLYNVEYKSGSRPSLI